MSTLVISAIDPGERIAQLETKVAEQAAKIAWFEEQFRLAKHKQFGASSEKSEPAGQQELVFNEAEALADVSTANEEETLETVTYQRRKKTPGLREAQLEGLPTEKIDYRLSEEDQVCSDCGSRLHEMSIETRNELKIVPPQFSLVQHIQHIYACRNCDHNGCGSQVVSAPTPKHAFPNSLASPSAVAHIISEKYVEGSPLYRQEQYFERLGFALSRQTMANWMIKGAGWLSALYERMKTKLLERDILHADETTLQVLHEPGRAAQTNSYLWLYRSGRDGPSITLFEYQQTRARAHPAAFLTGYHGYLHVDGYVGYEGLSDTVTLVGCWAHARRGFTDALAALPADLRMAKKPTVAQHGLDFITKLYAIETSLKNASKEERHEVRNLRSQKVLTDFRAWLDRQSETTLPKGLTGKAIEYCRNQWTKLTAFLLDGRLELDNNRSERSIKPFVIGRKNWLFANTPSGARASATIYSIVETAKENGLNPFAYLTYVFERLPQIDASDATALDELLPWSESLPVACRVPVKKRPQ